MSSLTPAQRAQRQEAGRKGGRPRKEPEDRTPQARIALRLPPPLLAQLQARAETRGLSVSELVREIVTAHLNKNA